jgi:predicted metalloprotease with PDZ domain
MKYMYNTYYKLKKRGYTDAEFKQGLEKFAVENLDDFYKKYINGLTPIDYNKFLGYAGYKLTDELAATDDPSLGINIANNNGKKIVTSVLRGGAGCIATMLSAKKPGDKVSITVTRDALPVTLQVTLLKNNRVKYKIDSLSEASPAQLVVRKKWLNL